MGRQDNVEIFEDTQRLYSSNERLISAIKNSSAAQECFTGMTAINDGILNEYIVNYLFRTVQ